MKISQLRDINGIVLLSLSLRLVVLALSQVSDSILFIIKMILAKVYSLFPKTVLIDIALLLALTHVWG